MVHVAGLVDDLRAEKKSAEQQLSAIKERFEAVEKEFTGLLQTKVDGIKKQFEEKQQVGPKHRLSVPLGLN